MDWPAQKERDEVTFRSPSRRASSSCCSRCSSPTPDIRSCDPLASWCPNTTSRSGSSSCNSLSDSYRSSATSCALTMWSTPTQPDTHSARRDPMSMFRGSVASARSRQQRRVHLIGVKPLRPHKRLKQTQRKKKRTKKTISRVPPSTPLNADGYAVQRCGVQGEIVIGNATSHCEQRHSATQIETSSRRLSYPRVTPRPLWKTPEQPLASCGKPLFKPPKSSVVSRICECGRTNDPHVAPLRRL